MKKRYNIEEEVNRTLNLLDEPADTAAGEFFEARLNGRISGLQNRHKPIFLKPAFVFTAILLLTINVFTAVNYFSGNVVTNTSHDTNVSVVATEYDFFNNGISFYGR